MNAIIVHGGCDERPVPDPVKRRRQRGTESACAAGSAVLARGGSAVDAVEAALHVLEDDPVFDAGTGSFYTLDGDIEMDALLATSDGRAGGVAAIREVRYPSSVARAVMERTPHILLVGEGATRFARALGVPAYDPGSDEARALLRAEQGHLAPSLAELLPRYRALREGLKNTSTVGAVALDEQGLVVAGTSTGGIPQKLPGRVGDSAILGAGTFADRSGGVAAGASATGMGEGIIRLGAARALVQAVAGGASPDAAAAELIARFTALRNPTGIIYLDHQGREACRHNGYFMPVYAQRGGEAAPRRLDTEPDGAADYLTADAASAPAEARDAG